MGCAKRPRSVERWSTLTDEEERGEAPDVELPEGGPDGGSTSEGSVAEETDAIKVSREPTESRAHAARTLATSRRPFIKKSSVGHVQLLLDEISGTFLTEEFE
jgi:hypothetical protein